jgi:outer membrane protein OmpA-like peptidoglycan-associated protein
MHAKALLTRRSARHATLALVLAMLGSFNLNALAQVQTASPEPQLTPEPKRDTDENIYHDMTVYQVLEQRLKGLNERGHMLSDYDMAKAQCWVDVSFHEYSRNDRSDFPDASIKQAEGIIEALENNQTPSHDTPLISDATRLRADLWARLNQLKSGPVLSCAAQAVACAEVELVHAGTEYKQFGWRHANPYVEMAEDMTAQAENESAHCLAPPPPPPGPAAPSAVVRVDRTTLRADTLFAFKSSVLTKAGHDLLDELIGKIPKGQPIGGVAVVGYTDRIDVFHNPLNNQRLSEARAKSVATYLGHHGIDPAKITSYGRGASNPVADCPDDKSKAKTYACLAPNRRVEVVVTGVPAAQP